MDDREILNLTSKLQHANVLGTILDLLQWDEQVNLPVASGSRRSEQIALMSKLFHRASTDVAIGERLSSLEGRPEALSANDRTIIRWARRDFDRATRLPSAFVAEKSRLDSEAYHVWRDARERSDFDRFAPFLRRQIEMTRRAAGYVGWGERPYDYCIDCHDPGMTAGEISGLFETLRAGLVPLVREITASPAQPQTDWLHGFPVAEQDAFLRDVVQALGFDFTRGRIDVAVHPFCSGDAADTRLTTRFQEDEPLDSLYSAIHETGHGLYEQGLPMRHLGTPLGKAVGMAVHESQSRLWENQVGRSRQFWQHFESRFRRAFPRQTEGISFDEIHAAVNAVRPTAIRVDADEVTYNLHILVRFDLERRLFSGELDVSELPAEWNRLYRDWVGVVPASDAEGILQDVHWAGGMFGYFPSYCLGNMIAAQLWAAVQRAISDLSQDFTRGHFGRLLGWLRENVHQVGRRYDTRELVQKVTGEEISPAHLLKYLRDRYGSLYLPETR